MALLRPKKKKVLLCRASLYHLAAPRMPLTMGNPGETGENHGKTKGNP